MADRVAINTGTFVSGDLAAGVLTVTHSLAANSVHVTVEDDLGNRISPDVTYTNANVLTLDFGGYSFHVSNPSHYRVSL